MMSIANWESMGFLELRHHVESFELRLTPAFVGRVVFGVYRATPDGKVFVAEPFRCQVGCSMCVSACPPRAITVPPRTILDAYRPGGR